ncbi:MAG: FAD-dependent oxidoreductase, partial [Pseudomonadota bacterium]
MSPVAGARLTVINPGPTAPYSGMLPGHVAGHYTRDDLDINLVRLCRMAGARFISGKADGLDLMNKTVSVPGRPPVPYDLASLDIGITSEMPKLPGFIKHAHPAKPLGPFARDWEVFVADDGPKTVAVIGAGVAGCELAMAMAYRLQGQPAEITLIEAGDEILRDTLPRTRARLRHHLDRLGITLRTGAGASEVTADGVHLSNGGFVDARYVTGAAATRPQTWLERTHLELHDGFIKVRPDLRSSDPSVYAVGDCAHLTDNPRPKAGVYAVRQAPFLFANLRADLTGRARRPYRPQPGYLKLISVGDKIAVADKFGITIEGKHWWALKDRIDAKFMGQFKKLKPMSLPAPSGDVSRGVADL